LSLALLTWKDCTIAYGYPVLPLLTPAEFGGSFGLAFMQQGIVHYGKIPYTLDQNKRPWCYVQYHRSRPGPEMPEVRLAARLGLKGLVVWPSKRLHMASTKPRLPGTLGSLQDEYRVAG
jgi:hypothetical protein